MKKTITPLASPLHAIVDIPGSKSMTNRALFLAALADGVSEISNMLISDDTRALIEALHQLGIVVQLDKTAHTCLVAGGSGSFPKEEVSIWCGEAGTVARFLLAGCALSSGNYYFDGSPALCARPFEPLLKVLSAQGVKILPHPAKHLPLTLSSTGQLRGGDVTLDSSQSSQFASALLMVAPFSSVPFTLDAPKLVSASYVNMTIDMMAEFGVMVRHMHRTRFFVPVPQRYIARDYVIEPDLSTASYFFAAAAITQGEVTVPAIHRSSSKQGDVKFLSLLEKMGCTVLENTSGLTVKGPAELQGVNIDMRDFSDTFMTLASIAPFAKTPTTITNISHTQYQESNRIMAIQTELEKLKIRVESGEDWIKIYPSTPEGTEVYSHHDHRIAMSLAVIGLRAKGMVIEEAECVSKTCPEFFTLWEKLSL